MKKFLLITMCLLLGGCYNYLEPEDMAVVSLMSIDYYDNKFNIILELRDNVKEDENASTIYTGSGSSVDIAIQNISSSLSKTIYLIDLDVLLLSEDAVNYRLNNIIDYLMRDSNIGSNFNLVISKDNNAIIHSVNNKGNIAGEYIKGTVEKNINNVINVKFSDFLEIYFNPYYDIILPYAKVSDENLVIDNSVIFKKDKIINIVHSDYTRIYNFLNNKKNNYLFEINYDDKQFIYKVNSVKSKIKYDNEIIININVVGSFDEMDDVNLDNDVEKLLINVKDKIYSDINNYINLCKKYNSDSLGFRKKIFNKIRKKFDDISDIKYKINVNVKLERSGMIFNSMGDFYEKYN